MQWNVGYFKYPLITFNLKFLLKTDYKIHRARALCICYLKINPSERAQEKYNYYLITFYTRSNKAHKIIIS